MKEEKKKKALDVLNPTIIILAIITKSMAGGVILFIGYGIYKIETN